MESPLLHNWYIRVVTDTKENAVKAFHAVGLLYDRGRKRKHGGYYGYAEGHWERLEDLPLALQHLANFPVEQYFVEARWTTEAATYEARLYHFYHEEA
jgi:hypothetical protein